MTSVVILALLLALHMRGRVQDRHKADSHASEESSLLADAVVRIRDYVPGVSLL